MRDVSIIGTGMVRFGRYPDKGLVDIAWPAVKEAVKESGVAREDIGAAQLVEVTRQLQGRRGKLQVEGAKIGMTHVTGGGVGGLDHGTCTMHILAV